MEFDDVCVCVVESVCIVGVDLKCDSRQVNKKAHEWKTNFVIDTSVLIFVFFPLSHTALTRQGNSVSGLSSTSGVSFVSFFC